MTRSPVGAPPLRPRPHGRPPGREGRGGEAGGIRDLPWREGRGPEPWDAVPYERGNPLAADARGSFSWDVPEGWWQVRVEAEGYRPATSEWVRVPSAAELDVPVVMEPASLSAGAGGVPPRAATRSGFLRDLGIAA